MICIIGSGLAGYNLAKSFRVLDKETPLMILTKHEGRFYHKPKLSTALTQKKEANELTMSTAEDMAKELNADIRTKVEVKKIDPENKIIYFNDEKVKYDKCVLAVGAEVVRPPLIGNAVQDVLSVNDLEAYDYFREIIKDKKHVAILGAGLVGVEFANDLINSGHRVDVIAPCTHPVDRLLPEEIGRVLENALADNGVRWHLEQLVSAVNKTKNGYMLNLPQQMLEVDVVMSAIGLRPNTHLAEEAGVKVNRGILVDRYLETNVKDIYALGDCAEVNGMVLFFIAPLRHCVASLAKTLAGEPTKVSYPAMPIGLKTPACPLTVCPPPQNIEGEWRITGQAPDVRALYYDEHDQLYGFALTGAAVKERPALIQQIPALFE